MGNSKEQKYLELVENRKQCEQCEGLVNPSRYENGYLDSQHIGPWSRWQGNLESKLMVIGQDWGTVGYFRKWRGLDQPRGNPTNDNLIELLLSIGIRINNPGIEQKGEVFFTNAVLCLKEGNLQSPIKPEWVRNCGERFLKPLIEVIHPKIVVALGEKAFKAAVEAYNLQIKWSKYKELVEADSISLQEGVSLFPVYHCGARIMNTHRNKGAQVKDWRKISLG